MNSKLSFFRDLSIAKRYALSSALLAVVTVVFSGPLTSSMALHMLVHIPAIVLAGVLAGYALSARPPMRRSRFLSRAWAQYQKYNEYGVPGLLLVSLVGAYWMIPKALDQVLFSMLFEWLKTIALFVSGLILMDSLKRANTVIKLFFLGNFCWMMAIVGMLYQEDPTRLCNFYLLNDQEVAGIGLVVLAAGLPVLWLITRIGSVRRFLLR